MDNPESGIPSPTQNLRNQLSAFRFNAEPRRSSRFFPKPEEEDSSLPALPSSALSDASPSRRQTYVADDTDNEEKQAESSSRKRRRTGSSSPKKRKAGTCVTPSDKYAHLNGVPDHFGGNSVILDVMFCGINPGQMSATVGHHYAHPTNHFWKCLHLAQFTDKLLKPHEDSILPHRYKLGLTNLVERPSAQAAELASSEFTGGVPALLQKIVQCRPRIVCFVGKGIWDSFIRALAPQVPSMAPSPSVGKTSRTAKARSEPFVYDLQPYKVVHAAPDAIVRETLFSVVVSTSGLVAGYQLPKKVKQFSTVKKRVDELARGVLDTSAMAILPVPRLP